MLGEKWKEMGKKKQNNSIFDVEFYSKQTLSQ